MMKKTLLAFGLSLLLFGCSMPSSKDDSDNPTPAIKSQETANVKMETFYFNAGETGLTLLNTDNDDFSIKLSKNPIGEANIVDGILTFTEIMEKGENIQIVNLEAYSNSLKN